MTVTRSHQQPLSAVRGRLLLWAGAIVLLLQLFAAVGHDHKLESQAQECVACSVQAQSNAAPPAPQVLPAAVAWMLALIVVPMVVAVHRPGPADYLLPQPHAPPASLLAS